MSEQFGLPAEVIDRIRAALAGFEQIRKATIYGSRAKGTYKPGSDVDLALATEGELPTSFLTRVAVALDELDLAYSFDISLLHCINSPHVFDHIRRVGVEFYDAGKFAAEKQRREKALAFVEEGYRAEAHPRTKPDALQHPLRCNTGSLYSSTRNRRNIKVIESFR